jgi:protein involved in polysaccharide export with SLBB domain
MVFSSSLVRVLTIFLLCFGFGAVAQAQSIDAAGAMSAAPAGTSITLPPGVQLPPNIQIPPGVTINQSGGGRAGATGSPSSPNNAQPSQPNAQSGQPSNPAAASRSNATNPSNSNNQNTDSSPKPSGSDLATSNTRVPNAFQSFLFQITGKSVGIYGMDLFNRSNPFAALESVPVPANYVLSPGDQITVKIYSPALDVDQGYTINKDGTITLPKIGPVALAGTKAGELEATLKNYLSRILTNFNVYATVGQLKGIEIYVVGQTDRPGKYIVSSVSTLINALFATGGPTANGSMRNIQLVRQGKVVGVVDLYQFLLHGDSSRDLVLQAGDVIRIPPVGAQVALMGSIPNPAIYELSPGETSNSLEAVIRYAGNTSVFTSPLQVSIERIDPEKLKPLSAMAISLNKEGLQTKLKAGDIVTFLPIKPAFENAVSLRLLGAPSVRLPIKPGTNLHELLPNREALLTNLYFMRRFTPPTSGEGTTDDLSRIRDTARLDQINWEFALLERINLGDLSPQVISFNLEQAINPTSPNQNVTLQPGDIITIFSQKDLLVSSEKQVRVVRVQGEVRAPGIYQIRADETLPDVIAKAGGVTRGAYIYGTVLSRVSIREMQRKNLDQVVRNLQSQLANSTGNMLAGSNTAEEMRRQQALAGLNQSNLAQKIDQLKQMNPNGRLALELDPRDPEYPEITLEDGDEITVPRIPSSIGIFGAVYNEAAMLYKPNLTVADYLKNAGPTPTAETTWTFVLRADGSVRAPNLSGWFNTNSVMGDEIMPGDAVVVPERILRQTAWATFTQGLKDWTQIFFQLGLGAAAIQVLK